MRVTFLPRPLAAIVVGEEVDVAPFALLGMIDNGNPEAFGVNGHGLLLRVGMERVQVVDNAILTLLSDARNALDSQAATVEPEVA